MRFVRGFWYRRKVHGEVCFGRVLLDCIQYIKYNLVVKRKIAPWGNDSVTGTPVTTDDDSLALKMALRRETGQSPEDRHSQAEALSLSHISLPATVRIG
jgi:hypothetical protein